MNEYDLPEVVSLAEDEVCFGEESGSHFSQTTIAAGAFEAVLVPVLVHRLQQESLGDDFVTGVTDCMSRRRQ